MKMHRKCLWTLLVGFGVFLVLGLEFLVETPKEIVMDVAQSELESMDLHGTQEPGIYGTYSMRAHLPFIEVGYQNVPKELIHAGTITCAFYGFPEKGQVRGVTLHTYVDGELQIVKMANSLPTMSRDIDVVEVSFRLPVPRGGNLTCVVQADTEDGLCYRHTVVEKNGYNLRSNTKTEVYTEDEKYIETIN